jgi:hypothetical protein
MEAHLGGRANGSPRGSRYDFNDAVIPLGAALFAVLAGRRMPRGTH